MLFHPSSISPSTTGVCFRLELGRCAFCFHLLIWSILSWVSPSQYAAAASKAVHDQDLPYLAPYLLLPYRTLWISVHCCWCIAENSVVYFVWQWNEQYYPWVMAVEFQSAEYIHCRLCPPSLMISLHSLCVWWLDFTSQWKDISFVANPHTSFWLFAVGVMHVTIHQAKDLLAKDFTGEGRVVCHCQPASSPIALVATYGFDGLSCMDVLVSLSTSLYKIIRYFVWYRTATYSFMNSLIMHSGVPPSTPLALYFCALSGGDLSLDYHGVYITGKRLLASKAEFCSQYHYLVHFARLLWSQKRLAFKLLL